MLDERLQRHRTSGGERLGKGSVLPCLPPGAASVLTWRPLALSSPLLSKLPFGLGLVAGAL